MWAQLVERLILAGEHLPQLASSNAGAVPGEATSNAAWTEDHESASVAVGAAAAAQRSPFGETIYLLRCTRGGRQLHGALDQGRALEHVRDTAASFGQSCRLPAGAHIFVYPEQYEGVLASIRSHELRPHHVVVNEAFLPLVRSDLAALPSRANVRPGSLQPLAIVGGAGDVFVVERTFINTSSDRHQNGDAATQSTSQIRHIANPRY